MSHNTWIHRGVRVAVRPLVQTPITPNQLTALRLASGVAAAAAFAMGEPSWTVAGAALFVLSLLLDRADGELARLSGRISAGGHRFDLWADSACNALVFVGIGIGEAGGPLGLAAPPLGFLAGAAVTAVLWFVMRAEAERGARAAELPSMGGFDADDAMLAVPVAMLFGLGTPLVVAAAAGASLFALAFAWRMRRDVGAWSGRGAD